MLRKHDNPNITLSFDAASPFVNTAYGQTYAHNFFEHGKFGYFMDRAFDQQELVDSNLPAPFGHSPVMSRLTMGDLCSMGPGAQDKNGNYKFSKGQPLTDKQVNKLQKAINYMQNVIALLGTHKVILLYGSQCIQPLMQYKSKQTC